MKELLKQVKQYKKDSVLAPVYSALEVVMEVIIPFVMALLIDEGVEKGNMNKILLYGIIMIVLAMISLFAGMMAACIWLLRMDCSNRVPSARKKEKKISSIVY